MSSISSIETVTPRTLSPIPTHSRPVAPEHVWVEGEPENSELRRKRRGKERQTDQEYNGSGSDDDTSYGEPVVYPPTNDDEAESRRVAENLRRWEVAERQRRKLARESLSSGQSTSTSIVGDVSRRVSQFWPERKVGHAPKSSLGTHVALQSQDNIDTVPLGDINVSPTPSPLSTPAPSQYRGSEESHPDNPFVNPADALSPFSDVPHQRDTFVKDSTRIPPTPRPFDLPPPRTPPPPVDTSPRPTPPPKLNPTTPSNDSVEQSRWWHDWLCGCSEGPDRGGDYQAGRTNPFE